MNRARKRRFLHRRALLCAWLLVCAPASAAETKTVLVPGDQPWVDSGLYVHAGQTLNVNASGLIVFREPGPYLEQVHCQAGPGGTFHFQDDEIGKPFPLAAGGSGPAPCFALIGRIGDGRPFYVGQSISRVAQQSGRLLLGVNDFDHRDNAGSWKVTVGVGTGLKPVTRRWRVLPGGAAGKPQPDCDVIVFYVDGLIPDVVEEMAAMGHMPNFQAVFLDGGTHVENAITVFPSDTITSNGTMWTGCFSDRHGMKAQIGFNRQTGRSENYLGKMGPIWNDALLQPQGLDKAWLEGRTSVVRTFEGQRKAQRFRGQRTTGTPALYHYLEQAGRPYSTGVLPVMNDLSPTMWTRYLTDEAPYLGTQKADRFVDEANAAYAVEHLLRRQDAVTLIWLPETDTVSHHEYRGQFGMARRTLAEVDGMIGDVVGHLRRQGRLEKTYLMVVSDHGHIGGRFAHLDRYDIANEFFHRPREIDAEGNWIGGGLGLSVCQYRYENWTQGDSRDQFVYVEALGDGAGRIFLPKGHYQSGDWSGPNAVGDLLAYRISEKRPPVNLIDAMTAITVADRPQRANHPIDLVLAKIDDQSILVASAQRGYAVIDRRKVANDYEYRYRVVGDLKRTDGGGLAYQEVARPRTDPLRLVGHVRPELIGTWQGERDWLSITIGTPYPDSVVTLTRHLLWQPQIAARETAYAPDLVVTCNPGWQFNTFNEPGTAHGHPFHETMQFSFFAAGPGVRRGAVLADPVRSVDLLPTILTMAGVPYDPQSIDGRAVLTLFQSDPHEPNVVAMPLTWDDVDLGAWEPIDFRPRAEYPVQPKSINQPNSFWDLNNLVYNVMSVSELSVNRLIDDTARLLGRPRRPVQRLYRKGQDEFEHTGLARPRDGSVRLGPGGRGLFLNKIALGDYSWYSSGNLQRISNAVDWLQFRAQRVDQRLANPLGAKTVLGTPVTNRVVDAVQYSAWEVRRFGTKAAVSVLDEWLLNGLEDRADDVINLNRTQPAERPAQ